MKVQQPKRRPLSRYLKDFKLTQTHCAHCFKLLDRVTLMHCGALVNKATIARLDTPIDEATWLNEKKEWLALCRFCGDLHSKEQNNYFDIIGFKQYLLQQTEMSRGTIREYVVRLRRLGNHLSEHKVPLPGSLQGPLDEMLDAWLPRTSTNNYRIALRKYWQFKVQEHAIAAREMSTTSDIY